MSQTKAELIDGKGDVVFDTDTLAVDATNNRVGIGEAAPGTQVEVNGTAPYITIKNSTQEDTDGGRESRIIFEGEQSGGEISTLAQIEVSHDGAVDDEKGKIVFSTNDGDDGTAPTERMRIRSDGNVSITDGNLIFASGHGIDFSATSDSTSSMSNELLDDYEEGTFTIVFTDTTTGTDLGTSNTSSNIAHYIRVGRVCTINIHFSNFAQPGTGNVSVSGSAPFPSAFPVGILAGGAFRGFNSNTRTRGATLVIAGATRTEGGSDFYLHQADESTTTTGWDTAGDWVRDSNFNNPGILICGSYIIAEGS